MGGKDTKDGEDTVPFSLGVRVRTTLYPSPVVGWTEGSSGPRGLAVSVSGDPRLGPEPTPRGHVLCPPVTTYPEGVSGPMELRLTLGRVLSVVVSVCLAPDSHRPPSLLRPRLVSNHSTFLRTTLGPFGKVSPVLTHGVKATSKPLSRSSMVFQFPFSCSPEGSRPGRVDDVPSSVKNGLVFLVLLRVTSGSVWWGVIPPVQRETTENKPNHQSILEFRCFPLFLQPSWVEKDRL